MRILFVTTEYVTESGFDGGLGNYLHKTSLILSHRGHDVIVMVSAVKDEVFQDDGIQIIRVNTRPKYLKLFKRLINGKLFSALLWMVRNYILSEAVKKLHIDFPIDVVQYASLGGVGEYMPKEIPGIVRLSSIQSLWDKETGIIPVFGDRIKYYIERQALKRADAIFGPSYRIAEAVEKENGREVQIIESPLSLKKECDDRLWNSLLKGKKYLLYYGALSPHKGIKELGDIIWELLEKYPNLFFVFAGKNLNEESKPMMDYVWEKAQRHRGRCIYLGSLKHPQLLPVISNAYAVVLPSRIDNFPNTCVESMAEGKVVIGTRQASFDQLIDDDVNGFLCNSRDPISLLTAIEKVLNLELEQYNEMTLKAKKTIERLEPERIAEQLESYYKKIIVNKKVPTGNRRKT